MEANEVKSIKQIIVPTECALIVPCQYEPTALHAKLVRGGTYGALVSKLIGIQKMNIFKGKTYINVYKDEHYGDQDKALTYEFSNLIELLATKVKHTFCAYRHDVDEMSTLLDNMRVRTDLKIGMVWRQLGLGDQVEVKLEITGEEARVKGALETILMLYSAK